MTVILHRAIFALSGAAMLALTALTLVAMAVAPPCTGIMQRIDAYRFASVSVFLGAHYLLVWRRKSLAAAMVLPFAWLATGLLFLRYIDSLPMSCPR